MGVWGGAEGGGSAACDVIVCHVLTYWCVCGRALLPETVMELSLSTRLRRHRATLQHKPSPYSFFSLSCCPSANSASVTAVKRSEVYRSRSGG